MSVKNCFSQVLFSSNWPFSWSRSAVSALIYTIKAMRFLYSCWPVQLVAIVEAVSLRHDCLLKRVVSLYQPCHFGYYSVLCLSFSLSLPPPPTHTHTHAFFYSLPEYVFVPLFSRFFLVSVCRGVCGKHQPAAGLIWHIGALSEPDFTGNLEHLNGKRSLCRPTESLVNGTPASGRTRMSYRARALFCVKGIKVQRPQQVQTTRSHG